MPLSPEQQEFLDQVKTQIPPNLSDVCSQLPGLCAKVDAIQEKLTPQTLPTGDVGDLKDELVNAKGELQDWETGRKHQPFSPEAMESCPNCGPKLAEYVAGKISSLTKDEAKEIARQHKLWPPPTIVIDEKRGARA